MGDEQEEEELFKKMMKEETAGSSVDILKLQSMQVMRSHKNLCISVYAFYMATKHIQPFKELSAHIISRSIIFKVCLS